MSENQEAQIRALIDDMRLTLKGDEEFTLDAVRVWADRLEALLTAPLGEPAPASSSEEAKR